MAARKRFVTVRCSAITKRGKRCRKAALADLGVCATHNGANVGRPTIYDEELGSRVVQVLRAGGYVETAASVAGVTRSRLNVWLRRGDPAGTDPGDQVFRDFRRRVDQARAEGETRNVALIVQAAATNWQAAAWLLERSFPDRWARPSQREHEPLPAPSPDEDPFADVVDLAQRRRVR
jgi:hypothetical protein